jgi:hypothetical protein
MFLADVYIACQGLHCKFFLISFMLIERRLLAKIQPLKLFLISCSIKVGSGSSMKIVFYSFYIVKAVL